MGAAASLALEDELRKPLNCSDLEEATTQMVINELSGLRAKLMRFVDNKTNWPIDLSDILIGDERQRREACLREIGYIRTALTKETAEKRTQRTRGYSRYNEERIRMLKREEEEAKE